MKKQWVCTLIDTSVMRDFMSLMFVNKTRIQLQQKKIKNIYEVTSVDNTALSYNNKVVNHKIEDTQLQIESHVQNMWFNIMLISKHNVVLELLWLQNIDLRISFWCQTINFSMRKLVHMSKEMLKLDLQICTFLTDELKRELQRNSEQVKIL